MTDVNLYKSQLENKSPDKFIKRPVTYQDIIEGTVDFFEDFFRGAIRFEGKIDKSFFTKISIDGYAHLFKRLFQEIYKGEMIFVNFRSLDKTMVLDIIFNPNSMPECDTVSYLMKIARLSGMAMTMEAGHAKIYFPLATLEELLVYATTRRIVRDTLVRCFFEE